MTEQGSWTGTVRVPRPPNCLCGDALVDHKGRVVRVTTCPICMTVLLDSMRGAEYAIADERDGDGVKHVLLKQRDFFSP